jgi:tRNA A-37 threonylcarbamoyl transferase component Bud32
LPEESGDFPGPEVVPAGVGGGERMKTEDVSLQGIEWQFLSPEGSALLAELAEPSLLGEVVKANSKRRVVRLPGTYVKEVRYRGWPRLYKTLSEGTACREGRISLSLIEAGIAVPEVLAFGVEKKFGFIRRDLLLTREESGCKTLHQVMLRDYPALPGKEKHRLVEKFACFMKTLHDAGVAHADLHIGNILWAPEREKGHRFVLLDTDRVTLRKHPLSTRQRTDNLALVLSNLWTLVSRNQRFRFLNEYGVCLDRKGRWFVAELEAKALKHSRKVCRKKALASLGNNRRFAKEVRNGFTVFYRKRDGTKELLDSLLADPDGILERGQILKAGNTVRAARVEINGKYYFLKRFNCKGWSYSLKNVFRRSRAVRSWLVSWGFRLRSVPVPLPLVCLEERSMRLLGRSYILFDFVENSEPLSKFWPKAGAAARKDLLVGLGMMLGRMHFFGALHGDLKWSNILVRDQDCSALYLTDLDGSKIIGPKKYRVKRHDLDRFLLDLAKAKTIKKDQIFFLKCWGRWNS